MSTIKFLIYFEIHQLPDVYFWFLSCSVEYLVEFLSDLFNWKFLAILQTLSYSTKLSEVRLDLNSSQGIYKGKVYEMRNHVSTLGQVSTFFQHSQCQFRGLKSFSYKLLKHTRDQKKEEEKVIGYYSHLFNGKNDSYLFLSYLAIIFSKTYNR